MSGIRFDFRKLKRRVASVRKSMNAATFRQDLERHVSRTLQTCIRTTPARSAQVIESSQSRQWLNRINYIPSSHTLEDPTLHVKGDQHWLYSGGRWYLASQWRLSDDLFNKYQGLLSERDRRIRSISRRSFINHRKQARFLYRKSWAQVAFSLRVPINVPSQVANSVTRRKPKVEPPKGYGQWRGGRGRLTAVIFYPFLSIPSRYKTFNPAQILTTAEARLRRVFERDIKRRTQNELRKARSA